MKFGARHVIVLSLLGTLTFCATSRLTNDPAVLMTVGVLCLCSIQVAMSLHAAGLRDHLAKSQ